MTSIKLNKYDFFNMSRYFVNFQMNDFKTRNCLKSVYSNIALAIEKNWIHYSILILSHNKKISFQKILSIFFLDVHPVLMCFDNVIKKMKKKYKPSDS